MAVGCSENNPIWPNVGDWFQNAMRITIFSISGAFSIKDNKVVKFAQILHIGERNRSFRAAKEVLRASYIITYQLQSLSKYALCL